ncbi:MAG: hypothetical protein IJT15_00290 [Rickettsiales bacterium]|nr:hypothetical protein [Rickettsiales bacterium]
MQNNNDADTLQQELKNVVNKIRQMSGYETFTDSYDKKTHECISFQANNISLDQREIQILMSADTQALCQALIDTQPFWSLYNPYVKYSLIASECLVGTACCAGGPLLANAGLIGCKAATGIATCGIIPCCDAVNRAKAKSDHLSNYLNVDTSFILSNKKCPQAQFIDYLAVLSTCRIHTEDDKNTLLKILNNLTPLQCKPEQSQNNNYNNNNMEDINNESKMDLTNVDDKSNIKKN